MPAESYGDRAHMVTRIAEERKLGRRLVRGHPMIEAEVVYAVQNEYCETPEDFIARRVRLAFLDADACRQALPRVRCFVFPASSPCYRICSGNVCIAALVLGTIDASACEARDPVDMPKTYCCLKLVLRSHTQGSA